MIIVLEIYSFAPHMIIEHVISCCWNYETML